MRKHEPGLGKQDLCSLLNECSLVNDSSAKRQLSNTFKTRRRAAGTGHWWHLSLSCLPPYFALQSLHTESLTFDTEQGSAFQKCLDYEKSASANGEPLTQVPAQPQSFSAAAIWIEKQGSGVRNKVAGNWATCNSHTFMQTMKILFIFYSFFFSSKD